ncbi:MAG: hypothetical protein M9954_14380 [Cyclobacteriaceae bacterium]|nr:ribbon-helix-helix protein, CopG family [Cyclobacteriaceae bacterium]MCB9236466.1 ribbon-helix-helix protein, CopG family [Flammeovirgaceae bacterium]MCB0499388.1 ribbon-helix-helix protein, CopG family [Cyclobacteriaceae bacterium]MCO5272841.1 hypothetical protein [Cyclobacteriaceae bacterium]MCW5903027.1 ribbon-helix-helix protein, CopG family [Cyclobacteriaceae bacterium]
MLNIRLSEDSEKELARYCQENGLSKTHVVKEALALYLAQKRTSKTPFEAGAGLFGKEGSGSSDRSVAYKKMLKEKLNAKHAH